MSRLHEMIKDAVTGEQTVRYLTDEEVLEFEQDISLGVRAERNYKLQTDVDPIAGNSLRWADLTDEKRAAWTQYRTDLLNVPQQSGFPASVTWPTKPE